MGQNQLLQLVLAAIIVATAITIGINLATSSADQANKDAIISDLYQLSSIARTHYHRLVALGGGGYSFANFKIPKAFVQNEHGTIEHTEKGHKADHIHFEATGKNGIDPIRFEARITIDEIKLTELNKTKKKKK